MSDRNQKLMRTGLAVALGLLVSCAPGDTPGRAAGAVGDGMQPWRGDVSYPGLPHIGILFDLDGEPRIRAAPNMGFSGGPLEDFRMDERTTSFRWSLNRDVYACALRRQEDGTYQGPCSSADEPTIGMLMVPPGTDSPTGLARSMLEMSSVQWVRVDSDAARVWIAAEARNDVQRDSIATAVRRARADNAVLFGDVANALPIDVFLVADRQAMQRVVRRPVAGWTDPMAGTVALIGVGEHSVALRHELTHAISFNAWGAPHEGAPWLAEGLATWVAGECAGHSPHDLARDMRARGELVPVRALVDEFPAQNDIIAYLQSGSVVGYILETYGVDAFRRVWSGGADALAALGLNVARLERDWLRAIDARRSVPVDRDAIRASGCG